MHQVRAPSDAAYPAIIVLFTSSAGTVRPAIRSEHPDSSSAASSCEDMSDIERRGGMVASNGMPPLRTIWEKNMLTAFDTDMPSRDLIFICNALDIHPQKRGMTKRQPGVPARRMRIVSAGPWMSSHTALIPTPFLFPLFHLSFVGHKGERNIIIWKTTIHSRSRSRRSSRTTC